MYNINDFFSVGGDIYRIFFVYHGKYYLQKFLSTYIICADEDFLDNFFHKVNITCEEENIKRFFPYIRYIMTDKKIAPLREGTKETVDLYQIMDINTGALGGWIENYTNLEQSETAWIEDDGYVYGSSRVENSIVSFSTIVDSTIKNMIVDDCTVINSTLVNDKYPERVSIKDADITDDCISGAFVYNNKVHRLMNELFELMSELNE